MGIRKRDGFTGNDERRVADGKPECRWFVCRTVASAPNDHDNQSTRCNDHFEGHGAHMLTLRLVTIFLAGNEV